MDVSERFQKLAGHTSHCVQTEEKTTDVLIYMTSLRRLPLLITWLDLYTFFFAYAFQNGRASARRTGEAMGPRKHVDRRSSLSLRRKGKVKVLWSRWNLGDGSSRCGAGKEMAPSFGSSSLVPGPFPETGTAERFCNEATVRTHMEASMANIEHFFLELISGRKVTHSCWMYKFK